MKRLRSNKHKIRIDVFMANVQQTQYFQRLHKDYSNFICEYFTNETHRNRGYLFCHPFAEEQKRVLFLHNQIAFQLANAGYPVFMGDYYGCGDSEGEFEDATITGWSNDIERFCKFFIKKYDLNSIGLIGTRLGGYLACRLLNTSLPIEKAVLIEPVLSPVRDFKMSIRQKLVKELHTGGHVNSNRKDMIKALESNGSIDFDGYCISSKFYRDLKTNHQSIEPVKGKADLLFVHVSKKQTLSPNYQTFLDNWTLLENAVTVLQEDLSPFWLKLDPDRKSTRLNSSHYS